MQYLSAYTLASLSGKQPTEQSLTAILNATGKPVDAAQVKAVIQKLAGKQVHDLISKGQTKLGSGSGASGASVAAPAKGGKAEPKKEQKKPEPKKEQKKQPEPEPEQEDFNIDLFG